MLTYKILFELAANLLSFNKYPAVEYKICKDILSEDYNSARLTELRPAFMASDIVQELYREQSYNGTWGPFISKDYSAKDKFPTTVVAINRCLYIGLTKDDGDILFIALDNLEQMYRNNAVDPRYEKNERAPSAYEYTVAGCIEAIDPYNPLVDNCYQKWLYVAAEAFTDGAYSYEREAAAQLDVFNIKGPRLGYLPLSFLLSRKKIISPVLESAMLHHYGKNVYENGHFWTHPNPSHLPDNFFYKQTRRLFKSTDYLNMFRGNDCYMRETVEWLLSSKNSDGLWDYGTQDKDPWGYFEYLSTTRDYKYNRILNCTVEVLTILKKYLDNNASLNTI